MSDSKQQRQLFGTDGIRARWGDEPLTPASVTRLGRAIGRSMTGIQQRSRAKSPPRILIGRDPRASSPDILHALASGIGAEGIQAVDLGVITTPGVAYCLRNLGAACGIMISASHNPSEDNGIKLFGPDGFKLADDIEHRIEQTYFDLPAESAESGVHAAVDAHEHARAYREHLLAYGRSIGKQQRPLEGMKLVVDCANGSASELGPQVFEELGAQVTAIFAGPDGSNINAGCGALHAEVVAAEVTRVGADAGVTFDGDADRLMLVDRTGRVLNGDVMLAALAGWLKSEGSLVADTVVSTVMANLGLEIALRERGISLLRTQVGDRYVVAEMLLKNLVLGGEQSGHILHLTRGSTTGDGIFNAIGVLVRAKLDGSLDRLGELVAPAPQVLVNVRVTSKPDLKRIPSVSAALAAAEGALGGEGRVVLRYSGTEALARVMVEGLSQSVIEDHANAIANAIRGEIGA